MRITLLIFFFCCELFAESPIIIRSEKVTKSYSSSSASVRLITRHEIEKSNVANLAEFLKKESSIQVNTNGGPGQASSLFLRGSDARHVLVLVDEVEFSDVTSIDGSSRFEQISLDDIEKIEILKGNQGVLYGSGAIGGVIKITTRKGSAERNSRLKLSYGSYKSKKFSARTSAQKNKWHYMVSGSQQKMAGISAFNKTRVVEEAEIDPYRQQNYSFKLGRFWSEDHETIIGGRFSSSNISTDSASADVFGNLSQYQSDQYYILEKIKLNENFSNTLTVVRNETYRESKIGATTYFYDGDLSKYEWTNTLRYRGSDYFIFGLKYAKEVAKSLDSPLNKRVYKEKPAVYFNNYNVLSDFFFLEEGLRLLKEGSNMESVYRLGLGLKFSELTLKVNHGTGLKSPSLYQNFASFGGSQSLEIEKSKSYEVSLVQENIKHFWELSYFNLSYDNYIDYNLSTSKYSNIGDYEISGLELIQSHKVAQDLRLGLSYTRLKTRNKTNGSYLPRRPKHKASFDLTYFVNDYFEFLFDTQYVGRRDDTGVVKMPSYHLENITGIYKMTNTKLSLAINNLLNKKYEEIKNYGTPGRNFLLSYELKL